MFLVCAVGRVGRTSKAGVVCKSTSVSCGSQGRIEDGRLSHVERGLLHVRYRDVSDFSPGFLHLCSGSNLSLVAVSVAVPQVVEVKECGAVSTAPILVVRERQCTPGDIAAELLCAFIDSDFTRQWRFYTDSNPPTGGVARRFARRLSALKARALAGCSLPRKSPKTSRCGRRPTSSGYRWEGWQSNPTQGAA